MHKVTRCAATPANPRAFHRQVTRAFRAAAAKRSSDKSHRKRKHAAEKAQRLRSAIITSFHSASLSWEHLFRHLSGFQEPNAVRRRGRLVLDLGITAPLSQGVQARGKALRIRHINGMEVRKKRPRGFK